MLDLEITHRIADIIGGGVSEGRVASLIDRTLQGGHLVHGVKRIESLKSILASGVAPLSPDGGVSYWTSGQRIFTASFNSTSKLFGIDSSFFDYGSGALVITNKDLLRSVGIDVNVGDGSITINRSVPRQAIAVLGITGGIGRNVVKARFELLEKVVNHGYWGGALYKS